jgi:hypothetical protein
VLQSAQPRSGARFAAAVVHLTPCHYQSAAQGGPPPPLAPSHEQRLVRLALEGALAALKTQCPAVVNSRRERSLARATPLLSKSLAGERRQRRKHWGARMTAVHAQQGLKAQKTSKASVTVCPAGILLASARGDTSAALQPQGNPLQQACAMAGCGPRELEAVLGGMLQEVTAAALPGVAGEGGSKRPLDGGTSGQETPTDPTTDSQA